MKYTIEHQSKNRFHLKFTKNRLKPEEADLLYYALIDRDDVETVQVFARTAQLIVRYQGKSKANLLEFIKNISLTDEELKEKVPEVSARATNDQFKEEIISKCAQRVLKRFFLPLPVRTVWTCVDAAPFIYHGIKDIIHRNFSAEIVHASAIGASILTGDFSTASSITFLTEIGEILEEWTYKKSVDDLAQALALDVSKVWKVENGETKLVGIHQVSEGDIIQVSLGSLIPLDGVVVDGEAMVNQATMTGESVPVRKHLDSTVFAGTVIEEGELFIKVKNASGQTRYDKIVQMIEESESLKSEVQSRAEQVVSKLIPYTFGTAALTFLFTRNVTKAASVLMVDFSCAIEVAMPISVLSAMREASKHRITVKGGRYLEEIAAADTVIFDKTGTLTNATPVVVDVIPANGQDKTEMLRLAACLEEHFPHSLANAVVRAAKEQDLEHEEMHSKAEYIVAHGIASSVDGKRCIIGSYHFVFEDEKVQIDEADEGILDNLHHENSHLYMAIGGKLVAIIEIADPIKENTKEVIANLKAAGIEHIVMMTGDSEQTARTIAAKAGITEFYAEVLPEDKANYVNQEKEAGRKVIMIGDGINDSPALSAADVGIAMKEGAEIAQEIADITLSGSDLSQLVELKKMSDQLMKRMKSTATWGLSLNAMILVAGICGFVVPGTAAFFHNASTIGLCMRNMQNLLPNEAQN
ncbi:Lead, cadmium, zinc and mercury transporting ATPase [Lachnospiraceae bacterium TWA4]|nr:Lead, cadmium, zinc and mercury transporting ATPase [Lachnospiraceae bacterium TWA4]